MEEQTNKSEESTLKGVILGGCIVLAFLMILSIVFDHNVFLSVENTTPTSLPTPASASSEEKTLQLQLKAIPVDKTVYRYFFGKDGVSAAVEKVRKDFSGYQVFVFCGQDVWQVNVADLNVGTEQIFSVPRDQWCVNGGYIQVTVISVRIPNVK